MGLFRKWGTRAGGSLKRGAAGSEPICLGNIVIGVITQVIGLISQVDGLISRVIGLISQVDGLISQVIGLITL